MMPEPRMTLAEGRRAAAAILRAEARWRVVRCVLGGLVLGVLWFVAWCLVP